MKDERYWPILGTWLKDTAEAPPDPRQTARQVVERLPQTPQLRRWWWLPSPGTSAPHRGGNQATNHHPVANSATEDRFPTLTGRTRLMPSPAKAMIAGALVFALGGAFIVAQPFEQREPDQPAVSSVAAWSDGTVVTATQECDSSLACTYSASDPRVAGPGGHRLVASVPVQAGDAFTMYLTDAWIEGPEGDWTGHHYLFVSVGHVDAVLMLAGDGAYEGWSYVAFGSDPEGDTNQDFTGVIYQGPLPPVGSVPIPTSG
jgi:hypothetical protein